MCVKELKARLKEATGKTSSELSEDQKQRLVESSKDAVILVWLAEDENEYVRGGVAIKRSCPEHLLIRRLYAI